MKEQAAPTRNILAVVLALVISAVAVLGGAAAQPAFAATDDSMSLTIAGSTLSTQDESGSITKGSLTVRGLEDFGGVSVGVFEDSPSSFYFGVSHATAETVTIDSSDSSVVSVPSEYASFSPQGGSSRYTWVNCAALSVGKATLTISDGTNTIKIPVAAYPAQAAAIKSVAKATYKAVKLSWKSVAVAGGYDIMRIALTRQGVPTGDFKRVASVRGASTSKVTFDAPWDKSFRYVVVPYVEVAGRHFSPKPESEPLDDAYVKDYTLPKSTPKLKSVKKASGKGLKLVWSADAGARKFIVYRSTHENYGFKKIATTKKKTYTDKKAKKGVMYTYRIRASYGTYGTADSNTFSRMIAKKSKATSKRVKPGFYQGPFWILGQYRVMCYTQGSRIYAAYQDGEKIQVVAFNSKMKKVWSKTVRLPKSGEYEGFYHGPDGNNYIVLAHRLPANAIKGKTVIEVVKYNSSWKKGKTARIKGRTNWDQSAAYTPISVPAFDMDGSTLHIIGRENVNYGDYPSGVSYSIDTKTMKVLSDNSYAGTPQGNFALRFKDGGMYVADSANRMFNDISLDLSWRNSNVDSETSKLVKLLSSASGNVSLGGLEIGKSKIVTCGNMRSPSVQDPDVYGYRGMTKKNIFVAATDRKTQKSSVKWLTALKGGSDGRLVSSARMVKLGDDRFAVIYGIVDYKTDKWTVSYTVVNNAGKKLLAKKYANMLFSGENQPILQNGSIYWFDETGVGTVKLFRIPAL